MLLILTLLLSNPINNTVSVLSTVMHWYSSTLICHPQSRKVRRKCRQTSTRTLPEWLQSKSQQSLYINLPPPEHSLLAVTLLALLLSILLHFILMKTFVSSTYGKYLITLLALVCSLSPLILYNLLIILWLLLMYASWDI